MTEEEIQIAVERQLQAAGNQTDQPALFVPAALLVRVWVSEVAFVVQLAMVKEMTDTFTGQSSFAKTWDVGGFGPHGGNVGFILQIVHDLTDQFITEHLRVNAEEAC